MDINNLKESPLVSAAEPARRLTRWWLAYLICMPVLLFVVGGATSIVGSLIFPPNNRGMGGQFSKLFNMIFMFLALFL